MEEDNYIKPIGETLQDKIHWLEQELFKEKEKNENLISENKELKEDNRVLERRLLNANNRYKRLNDNFQRCQIKTTDIVNSKYIHKSKLKEVIEEKKSKDLEIYDTDSEDVIISKYEERAILDFCKELLEENKNE